MTLEKFTYESGTGKMTFALTNAAIALPAPEAHVTLSLHVSDKLYFTGVTLFETKPDTFALKPSP